MGTNHLFVVDCCNVLGLFLSLSLYFVSFYFFDYLLPGGGGKNRKEGNYLVHFLWHPSVFDEIRAAAMMAEGRPPAVVHSFVDRWQQLPVLLLLPSE